MQQEGMDERGVAMQRPPNRLADPHYPYAARASGQVGLMVVRHTTESTANAASCTRLISAVCPPRGGPSRLVAPTRRVDGPGTTGKVRRVRGRAADSPSPRSARSAGLLLL